MRRAKLCAWARAQITHPPLYRSASVATLRGVRQLRSPLKYSPSKISTPLSKAAPLDACPTRRLPRPETSLRKGFAARTRDHADHRDLIARDSAPSADRHMHLVRRLSKAREAAATAQVAGSLRKASRSRTLPSLRASQAEGALNCRADTDCRPNIQLASPPV